MSTLGDLSAEAISASCPRFVIEVHSELGSTQDRARQRVQQGLRQTAAVIADQQTAGRGQRGRRWQSPAGAAIYMTLVWPSARRLADLSGLSLVIGLSIRACLARWQVDARLKWPNDVWVDERKLAGVLIEAIGERDGSLVLIGIGLNVALPALAAAAIDQAWIDLAQILGTPPPRERLIAALLEQLSEDLDRFELEGLSAFQNAWSAADALYGRTVWLNGQTHSEQGQACGIDELGRLQVRVAGHMRIVVAGEVSIRAV